jgi:hypothetical protein
MKELNTEVIEIGGKEYTLFLNRKGVVAFENASKLVNVASEMTKKYKNNVTDDEEIDGNVNPLEEYGENSELENDVQKMREVFTKFYWIALYENHKLTLDEVKPLFEEAENEYGLEQLVELANQMIEDVNKEPERTSLKKLTALRPKKK